MRSYSNKITLSMILLMVNFNTLADQPAAPYLTINTKGLRASLNWSSTKNANGYQLFYAPYPYQGEDSIASIDLGTQTTFAIELWQKAAFYVAVKSYDTNKQTSHYSNIGFVKIDNRDDQYQFFWETTIKEINDQQFVSDGYLYFQPPNPETCLTGSINDQAKDREVETLNQIRRLHNLSAVKYDDNGDFESQSAALIQKANNFLSHTPPEDAKCFSQSGFIGSNHSNLTLTLSNEDPAKTLINLIDDAFNVSAVSSVGHRRHLLNPFLQFTSYGQVSGASAVKVFNFDENTDLIVTNTPNFVAFPYLRYPYVFLSDKQTDKKTPWNISIVEDSLSSWANQHDYFSKSKVTVTQKDNNQGLAVQDLFSDTNGTGIPNNLSWVVDDWQYDTWYTVSIDNINYQSGKADSIEYDVFIDYKNFFNISFPAESGDILENNNLIQGTLQDIEDKDSFQVSLSGNVFFTGSSQFSNTAFFIEVYDSNKQLLHASDHAFSLSLPNSLYTVVVTSCHNRSCYSGLTEYSIQIKA